VAVERGQQITTLEARPPRQWDDSIAKELERICLKALAKRAADRYLTAKDLADDLRSFLEQSTDEEKDLKWSDRPICRLPGNLGYHEKRTVSAGDMEGPLRIANGARMKTTPK
jgi:hypothetical protein